MTPLLLSACATLPDWLRDISVLGVHISIANFLNTYGYIAVFIFIAIESTGIPFPGETMLVTASVYAAQGCGLQIQWVIVACILGATIGDNFGFWIGRTGGRELIRKYGRYVWVNESHLAHAEQYFQRYGGATVFFGRFLAILRAWAAFLAGVNHMQPLRFFIYNLAGAILWSTTFGLLGYTLGKSLDKLKQVLTALGTGGAILAAALIVLGIGIIWYRSRRARMIEKADTHEQQHTLQTATRPVSPAQGALPHTMGSTPDTGHDQAPPTSESQGSQATVPIPLENAPVDAAS